MPKSRFSAASLPNLSAGEHTDWIETGLILRKGDVRSSWFVRTIVGTSRRKYRLGAYPAMGLAEARQSGPGTAGTA